MSPVVAVSAMGEVDACEWASGNVKSCCRNVSCRCDVLMFAGGCASGCTAPGAYENVAGGGCANAVGYCMVHVDGSSP